MVMYRCIKTNFEMDIAVFHTPYRGIELRHLGCCIEVSLFFSSSLQFLTILRPPTRVQDLKDKQINHTLNMDSSHFAKRTDGISTTRQKMSAAQMTRGILMTAARTTPFPYAGPSMPVTPQAQRWTG